jgi:dipeptidyl aminopeptidase/acylaminoacyl peptidase
MGSTLLTPAPARHDDPPALDPELLIEEARDRQRRRRRRWGGLLIGLAALAVTAFAIVRLSSSGKPRVEHVPGSPTVDIAAFAHHGELAFISRNTLWVLDGTRRSLRQIETTPGQYPLHPTFSSDGEWIAWVQTATPPSMVPGGGGGSGQLWLARGDGRNAHPVSGLAHATLLGWSPNTDVLAVTAGPISNHVPYGAQTTVRLVDPDGGVRELLRARDVKGGVWSPDGHRIALVIETRRLVDILAAYPIDGGAPTIWQRFDETDHLNGMTEIVVDPVGWWRGLGIGLWVYGDGAVHNNDATPLDVVAAPGGKPRLLTDALSDGTTRVVTATDGTLAVVADISHGVNGGRIVWDKKQLQTCTRSAACEPVVVSPSKVTLDPAWSPDGRTLAFVEAPDLNNGGWTQSLLKRWHRQHVLRLLDLQTRRIQTIAAAKGATAPSWSPDGKSLLYVARNGIWLLPTLPARPIEIASPLFKPTLWPSFYGQMAWPAQFAWSGK